MAPRKRTHLVRAQGYAGGYDGAATLTYCGKHATDDMLAPSMGEITCAVCLSHAVGAYGRFAPSSLTVWGQLCYDVQRREHNVLYAIGLLDKAEKRKIDYAAGNTEVPHA